MKLFDWWPWKEKPKPAELHTNNPAQVCGSCESYFVGLGANCANPKSPHYRYYRIYRHETCDCWKLVQQNK